MTGSLNSKITKGASIEELATEYGVTPEEIQYRLDFEKWMISRFQSHLGNLSNIKDDLKYIKYIDKDLINDIEYDVDELMRGIQILLEFSS